MPHRHRGPNNLRQEIYIQDEPLIPFSGRPILPPPSVYLPSRPPQSHSKHISQVEAGPSSVTSMSFVYPPQYNISQPREAQTQIWVISFVHYILSAVCMVYTMGLYRLYYRMFRFRGSINSPGYMPFDYTWSRIVERMSGIWKLARIGCGALLPLSIALLQIEGVVNAVVTRTATITTAIFATAGLISSAIYLFFAQELINNQNKARWLEASRHSYALKSVEFWTYLALPMASLTWAILMSTITVIGIAWTNNHNNTEATPGAFIGSAVFITFTLATSVIYLYRASAMVIRY